MSDQFNDPRAAWMPDFLRPPAAEQAADAARAASEEPWLGTRLHDEVTQAAFCARYRPRRLQRALALVVDVETESAVSTS